MKVRAFVVINANVLASAICSGSKFSADVLKLVGDGGVIPVFDEGLREKYYTALNCSENKERLTDKTINDVLCTVINNGIRINNVELAKNKLLDSDVVPFFEVEENSEEDFSEALAPKVFLALLGMMERWVKTDFDYDICVDEIMKTQTTTLDR